MQKNYNPTIIDRIFMKPEILHYTLFMLSLEDEEKVEQSRLVLISIENEIKEMIKNRGENGKLKLEFAGLDVFGTPENTRVIFMKLKESGP